MPPRSPPAGASLDEWLRWQEALHPQGIALGLDRMRPVATRLGLPAAGLRTITVGGTNGKGSATALLSEIHLAAGRRVGTYTSPHLLRYNERVAIGGRAVGDAELVTAFEAVEQARRDVPLTYFEFGTLAALWLFARAELDLQVLEVGLGGRLDAVNLVDADCALITSVGIDHVEYLGTTREQIGHEKAGILRPGRPGVCADPEPPATIERSAATVGARLWQLGRDFDYQVAADMWHWRGGGVHFKKLPAPALPGRVQFRNAAGVLAVVDRMQPLLPVAEEAIRTGLARLSLPGRFERRRMPDGDVVLDVAHNVQAAHALADNLRALPGGPARIVIGMLSDKPAAEFCAVLAPLARTLYFGGLPPPRGLSGTALAERARTPGVPCTAFASVEEAFAQARRERAGGETIVACGSFLTVAAIARVIDG